MEATLPRNAARALTRPCVRAQVLLVTGAGQGLGRAVAVAYATHTRDVGRHRLVVVLVGRHADTLEATAARLNELGVEPIVHVLDLQDVAALPQRLDELAARLPADAAPARAVLVSNAGSLGDIAHPVAGYDVHDVRAYVDFNLTSFAIVSTWFLQTMQRRGARERVLVNISSLLAVKAFPYWGLYGAAKAGRDALYAAIAAEGEAEGVRTLSYAPGPLDGDMQADVRARLGDVSQRQYYQQTFAQGKLVALNDSAHKLVRLLGSGAYVSGSHVDYYDV